MWVRVFRTRNNNIFVVIAIIFGVGPISRNPGRVSRQRDRTPCAVFLNRDDEQSYAVGRDFLLTTLDKALCGCNIITCRVAFGKYIAILFGCLVTKP